VPESLEIGMFNLQIFHKGALMKFSYNSEIVNESFKQAVIFVYSDLNIVLKNLIQNERGLKVIISINTLLERIKDESDDEGPEIINWIEEELVRFMTFCNARFAISNWKSTYRKEV